MIRKVFLAFFVAAIVATLAGAANAQISVLHWQPFVQRPAASSFTPMTITVNDPVGGSDINILIVDSAGNRMTFFPETHVPLTVAGTNVYTSASLGIPLICQNSGPWRPALRIRSSGLLVPAPGSGTLFGDVRLYIGQSNAEHMWSQSSSPPTPSPRTIMYVPGTGAGTGWLNPTGNGLITLLNTLTDLYGVPQAVIAAAVNGSALTLDGSLGNAATFGGSPVQYWTDPTSAMRVNMAAALAVFGNDIKGVIWDEGETESGFVPPEIELAALHQFLGRDIPAIVARRPLSIAVIPTGFHQPSPTLGIDAAPIRDAQRKFVRETPGAYIGATRHHLPRVTPADNHLTPAGYGQLGMLLAVGIVRREYLLID